MQGVGEKNIFAGLPEPFSSEKHAEIVILPVLFDQTTTYQHGSDKGPLALIEASRNMELYDIETQIEVYKKGIFTAPSIKPKNSKEMIESTYQAVKSYIKKDKFVVTLGGEHAISYAPIRAHAEHYGKISILQFDAHTDLVMAYEGDPLSHASVMARVRELKNVSDIVSVGIRSMASEEVPFCKEGTVFFAHDILNHKGDWVQPILNKLSDKVYITFDLDAFDSSLMPATGTPEPGGLFWHHATKLLWEVAKRKEIVGFDVVELCPIKGFVAPDFAAAKLTYKLLSYIYKNRESFHEHPTIHEKTLQTL